MIKKKEKERERELLFMFPSSFSPFKIRLKEYVIFLFYRNKNILEQNWHYFLFMAYKLNLNKLQNFKKK